MKSKYLWWGLTILLALFTAVSCKSTPAAPPEEPAVETTVSDSPDQASLDALNAAAAKAAAARKVVMDFGGPSFFPNDWKDAEDLYNVAEKEKKTSTRQSVQESTARYNKAAGAFEAMTEKTYAAAYEYGIKELTAARNAAVAAGAQSLIPDYLLEVDNVVADADAKYKAKDYYGAKDTALKAFSMYEAQTAGLNAYNVRMEIADRGFEVYDSRNIENADNILRSGVDDYFAKNFDSAKGKADDALARYNLSLKTAWETHATERRAVASTERQRALDIRANVAVRQDFNAAQSVFAQANTSFQAKKFDEAAKLFDDCSAKFTAATQATREKQRIATEALNRANQRMAESDQKARDAEKVLEGGAQ